MQPPLPELLFGVATADHQSEAYESGCDDIRDAWERSQKQTERGRATDFWNRYPEDIALAAQLGCKLFRFSIAWSRVEPRPGEYDRAVLDHYKKVADTIREAGMQPLITLLHFTWPIHVADRGGLTARDFPGWYADYARVVVAALGPGVPYWVTFNEPNLLVYGYVKPWWQKDFAMPPGLSAETEHTDQFENAARLMRNLFKAHTLGRRAIHQVDPTAKIGTNPFVLGMPSILQWLLNQQAMRTTTRDRMRQQQKNLVRQNPLAAACSDLKHRRHPLSKFSLFRRLAPFFGFIEHSLRSLAVLSAISNSDWWALGMAGQLPSYLCPDYCHGQQDFVGFDYYWGINTFELHRISQLLDASMSKFFNAPVEPSGLLVALRRFHRLFPKQEILIVENGCIEAADGYKRHEYIDAHVSKILMARREGIPVAAYFCWSITSNREWGLAFSPASDFGLYHIDLDTDPQLIRKPTKSAEIYADIIRENSLPRR